MGKSTTAEMFRVEGIPVWSADEAVHRLYAKGGAAVPLVKQLCANAIVGGAVDREVLTEWIARTPGGLKKIESLVHPLVAADREAFIEGSRADIVLADIPLLFESGSEGEVDYVVVVSAPADEQRRRVMERPGMSEEKFALILSKQLPDEEKRARADVVIETLSLEATRQAVQDVLKRLKAAHHAGNRPRH